MQLLKSEGCSLSPSESSTEIQKRLSLSLIRVIIGSRCIQSYTGVDLDLVKGGGGNYRVGAAKLCVS